MRIVIEGKPIPKHRPRFSRRGKFVTTYSDQVDEEKLIKLAIKPQLTHYYEAGALEVKLFFFMPIPKATSKKKRALMACGSVMHTKKPDVDNIVKFYLDCLNGVAFKDDSQIVKIIAAKHYDEHPRTIIEIIPINIIMLHSIT